MSAEWDKAAADLCAWAQEEGFAGFAIRTNEDGSVRFVGPRLPVDLVARMLRSAADGYEAQVARDAELREWRM